ncbi:MAG: Alpha-ketoglutarate-dependent dioxygenase alkB 6 [Candelina mexicana]|nr:MAG: Alpha-ketoglutarate-dependent dioxygenase alkB 6 [Candelina mexicana]
MTEITGQEDEKDGIAEQGDRLENYRIKSLPPTAYYIPNFITASEEESLLNKITTSPSHHWTSLTHRRLQSWPSKLTPSNKLLSTPLPSHLSSPILPRLQRLQVFANSSHKAPNHVLINEYTPGQGIMPHEDGDAYYPLVATVSLGSATVLDIYSKNEEGQKRKEVPRYRILQERRSLLVTGGEMYTDHLHGIGDLSVDEELRPSASEGDGGVVNWELIAEKEGFEKGWCERGTRVSLTYRDVRRVTRMGNVMSFMGAKR